MPSLRPLRTFLVAGLALAAVAPAAHAQSIVNMIAGAKQTDNTYLWKYKVTSGSYPSINYWVLGICCDTYQDIIPSSIINGGNFCWVDSRDTAVGIDGIKFDLDYNNGETKYVSFRTKSNWTADLIDLGIKSGRSSVDHGTVTGPGCNTFNTVPEPSTVALLALAALPGAVLVRRRK